MKAQNPPLILLRHADLYAPDPRGLVQILIGAGRILWIGQRTPQLDRALNIAQVVVALSWALSQAKGPKQNHLSQREEVAQHLQSPST